MDHVRKTSKTFVQLPGLNLALDEMIRFTGRSVETHRLKNKPVDEGYKFFCLADSKTG